MKKILINGAIIIGLYLLFVIYLLFYSERIEQLNENYKDNSLFSINYGE